MALLQIKKSAALSGYNKSCDQPEKVACLCNQALWGSIEINRDQLRSVHKGSPSVLGKFLFFASTSLEGVAHNGPAANYDVTQTMNIDRLQACETLMVSRPDVTGLLPGNASTDIKP